MLIDTHAHVADAKFDADREAVIARAQSAGVELLIEIAESPDTWEAAIALAERYAFVYVSLGIHPHHAHEVLASWDAHRARLRQLLDHPKVKALGEFGLDYFRMQNTREQQDLVFRRQLQLARDTGKPIVIHCRDGEGGSAQADVQKAIAEFYPERAPGRACPDPNGVIHCFSGQWQDAQIYMSRGFLLGVDGPVTYPNSHTLQTVVRQMPLERLVLETDSPYLPPQTHRGQRNEPTYLPAIAAAIATLKHSTPEQVAEQTSANARALFRLP